jgi:hypothetical protein
MSWPGLSRPSTSFFVGRVSESITRLSLG